MNLQILKPCLYGIMSYLEVPMYCFITSSIVSIPVHNDITFKVCHGYTMGQIPHHSHTCRHYTVICTVSDETCGILLTCGILIIKIIKITITITLLKYYTRTREGGIHCKLQCQPPYNLKKVCACQSTHIAHFVRHRGSMALPPLFSLFSLSLSPHPLLGSHLNLVHSPNQPFDSSLSLFNQFS